MANGIARLRKIGIAAQPTFGTPATTATYVLPITNATVINTMVNRVVNNAALGSSYQINDVLSTTRMAEVPLEFKVDENQFPLLFKQRFTIASVTTTVSNVYKHTLSYSESTNSWYTLFLQDDNLQDYVVKDALLDNLDFTLDQDFVRVTANAIGAYPTQTNVVLTATQPQEFVGRMATFLADDYPGTATNTNVLTAALNFDFGLNSEDSRYGLGSADLAVLRLTSDRYTMSVTKLKDDVSYYDDYTANQTKTLQFKLQNTDRFVDAGTLTRPLIQFDIPRAKIETYTEEPNLEELTRETIALVALKPANVTGTPLSITVLNSTASY